MKDRHQVRLVRVESRLQVGSLKSDFIGTLFRGDELHVARQIFERFKILSVERTDEAFDVNADRQRSLF